MKFLKKIIKTLINKGKPVEKKVLFFTKDIFKGDRHKIGEYTYGKPTILFDDSGANLEIGKFCSIAKGVTIFLGGNHRTDWITTYPFNVISSDFPEARNIKGHPSTKGDVIIGNDVWLGRNVTILSGISIGDGAVIAAGSVLTKNVGSYEIWGGNSAVFIKKRFSDKEIHKLQNLKWWEWNIKKIRKNIPTLCSRKIHVLNNE